MHTLQSAFGQDSCYSGDRGHWFIAATVHRDSDLLEQSNFAVTLKRLSALDTGIDGETDITIERASHWACGWVDRLIINPENTAMVTEAQKILVELEDYPALDDEDLAARELEEHNEYHDHPVHDCYFCETLQKDHHHHASGSH